MVQSCAAFDSQQVRQVLHCAHGIQNFLTVFPASRCMYAYWYFSCLYSVLAGNYKYLIIGYDISFFVSLSYYL
jgi:hypothetical protein